MFQKERMRRLAPLAAFGAGYTLVFWLWKLSFLYTLPFLLGLLAAAALQPVIRFAEVRLHMSHRTASGAATILALLSALAAFIFLAVLGIRELSGFLMKAAGQGFPEFTPPVQKFFRRIGEFFQNMDGDFWQRNWQNISDWLKDSAGLAAAALGGILKALSSLPMLVALALVIGFSTFFISRDFSRLRDWAMGLLSEKTAGQLRRVSKHSTGTGKRYFLSYALIYFISFCEAFIILSILKIPYPLITAAAVCFADVLPVLGPGIVLTPVAVYQALTGAYGKALGVMVGWLVMTCVRQVIEPKLVASTVKIHPLAMLAAVYFSLTSGSLWTLLYTAGFFMLYSLLRSAEVLPSLGIEKEPPPEDEDG